MFKRLLLLSAATATLMILTGCETDGGISARGREKSAVYGALKPWEKRYVDKGVVSTGFTPDMVYIAVGNPNKKETIDLADGTQAELWTWNRYYPNLDATQMRMSSYTVQSRYTPALTTNAGGGQSTLPGTRQIPAGHINAGPSMGTGGPQGGSGEPADLQSYTLRVLFQDGKAVKVGADPNYN